MALILGNKEKFCVLNKNIIIEQMFEKILNILELNMPLQVIKYPPKNMFEILDSNIIIYKKNITQNAIFYYN